MCYPNLIGYWKILGFDMATAIISLFGVIIGACLTFAGTIYVNHLNRSKDAKYLAIRISCLLDRFVDGCVEVVQDDGIPDFEGRYPECMVPNSTHPSLELDSVDVDWRSISANLTYQILNLPSLIESANGDIHAITEYDIASAPDYSEYFWERQIQYSKLGKVADNLSKKLREQYSLPKREYGEWDPIGAMMKKGTEAIDKRTAAQKHNKDTMRELNDLSAKERIRKR
jgi:hypothetical protein